MGDPGSPRPRGTTTGIWPNTHQFIQEVNEKGLCGAKDWRLPAVSELHSISHGGAPISQRGPDPDFMPNLPAQVWSADSDAGFPANAWLVNTASGHDETEGKNRLSRGVVLVRGGP